MMVSNDGVNEEREGSSSGCDEEDEDEELKGGEEGTRLPCSLLLSG